MQTPRAPQNKWRAILLAGVIPLVAYTVIEDRYGVVWGLVAGMVFGVGEIIWELITQKRVDPMTWGGNGLLLILGGVSLFTEEGIWFKLQPSLMEAAMALVLIATNILGRPLLLGIMAKQGLKPEKGSLVYGHLSGMNFRMGLFFGFHAVLAAWAAFHWSTAAWAILKGVGFTLSMVVYMVVETLVLRYRIASK